MQCTSEHAGCTRDEHDGDMVVIVVHVSGYYFSSLAASPPVPVAFVVFAILPRARQLEERSKAPSRDDAVASIVVVFILVLVAVLGGMPTEIPHDPTVHANARRRCGRCTCPPLSLPSVGRR